jgi:hypothetical protein
MTTDAAAQAGVTEEDLRGAVFATQLGGAMRTLYDKGPA